MPAKRKSTRLSPRPRTRHCRQCGTPEIRSRDGLGTNLSPYSQLCPDCTSTAIGFDLRDPHSPYRPGPHGPRALRPNFQTIPYHGDYIYLERIPHNGHLVLKFRDFQKVYIGYSQTEALREFKYDYANPSRR